MPSGTFVSEGKKVLGLNTSKDKLILLLADNQNVCWYIIPEAPGPSGTAEECMACYMVFKSYK